MIRYLIVALILVLTLSLGGSAAEVESGFSLPINPDQYLVNPGDNLIVSFIGANLDSLILTINPEGAIIRETLGKIDLTGKTLTEARELLNESLKRNYNFEQVDISITGPRQVLITVTGAVERPGTHLIYSSKRVSDVIKLAGGVLPTGSSRQIEFRGGPKTIMVDLDRAEYLGEIDKDPFLYAGHLVYVPGKSNQTVNVTGEINLPREIELVEGDDVATMIKLAGGFSTYADEQNIKIIKADKNDSRPLSGGDIILVPPKELTPQDKQLALFGAIKNPGYYRYQSGTSLESIVNSAGGFENDANKNLTTIFRKPRFDVTGRVTRLRFPIANLYTAASENTTVTLMPGDSIFVPVKVGYVKVSGEVLNPGYFPFVPGKSARYFIENAGGFLPTANNEQILLYNPISKISSLSSPDNLASDGNEIIVNIKEELK